MTEENIPSNTETTTGTEEIATTEDKHYALKQAEKCVLGAAILNNDLARQLMLQLTPEMFTCPRHDWIWSVIEHLLDTNQPVEPISILLELATREQINQELCGNYLHDLTQAPPVLMSSSYYANVILTRWRARQLAAVCSNTAKISLSEMPEDRRCELLIARKEQIVAALDAIINESEQAIIHAAQQNPPEEFQQPKFVHQKPHGAKP